MAHVLIIELPGGNDADIAQAALDTGHTYSLLTAQLDHYRQQPALQGVLAQAQALIEVPGFDMTQALAQVLALHAQHPVDAVLCLVDIRITEAARLAQALKLRHIAPDTARLLRDKFSVRQRLAGAGIAQPPFALALSAADLHQAVTDLGLPLLIKPCDGYGSQNIVTLMQPEDLDPWLNPLDELLPSRTDYGLGVRANDRLLVERFMPGTVIGCDTFTLDGRHRLLGINEKLFYPAPSFAIRGGCFKPFDAQDPQHALIAQQVGRMLDALGITQGATHTELMLTDQGPQLIEVNPRLVGARIPRLISHALGRSVHADLIELHLGRWPAPPVGRPTRVAVTRWLVAEQAGTVQSVHWGEAHEPAVVERVLLCTPGQPVRPPMDNADRLGYVMALADNQADAERAAEGAVQSARLVLATQSEALQAA